MSDYKTDLEIAREAKKLKISEVASNRLSIDEKNLVPYGHFKAKLDSGFISELSKKDDGKLILVTAMTPTTAGEGKTTTSVGLTDGLNFIGKKAMVALREPSLGPCFGMKGGAAGGGYAQVVPMEDINLRAMITIGKTFDVLYGYSDHTLGIEVGIAAVALGASCIEKHFTLDKAMKGPDHKASIEPYELKAMVKAIRNIQVALGSDIKKPSNSEMANIQIVRKSIVASVNISKGDKFSEKNLAIKRPGNGVSPMKWDEIIGTDATKDYNKDELI